jgi:hypothetical protein
MVRSKQATLKWHDGGGGGGGGLKNKIASTRTVT